MERFYLEAALSTLASGLRLGIGFYKAPRVNAPSLPLELYDRENDPGCRRIRELLSELDFDVMIYPLPNGGNRFREKLRTLAGHDQIPYLVDPNTGAQFGGAEKILEYLRNHYRGGDRNPLTAIPALDEATAYLTSVLRTGHGEVVRRSRAPEKPLELYGFEGSSFTRLVRERLCELEIPYLMRNVAKPAGTPILPPVIKTLAVKEVRAMRSPRRAEFVGKSGAMMVPYLVDPNTGVAMFESAEIVDYLDRTYGAGN